MDGERHPDTFTFGNDAAHGQLSMLEQYRENRHDTEGVYRHAEIRSVQGRCSELLPWTWREAKRPL